MFLARHLERRIASPDLAWWAAAAVRPEGGVEVTSGRRRCANEAGIDSLLLTHPGSPPSVRRLPVRVSKISKACLNAWTPGR